MKLQLTLLFYYSFSILFGQNSIQLEIPFLQKKDTITNHYGYSVSYNHLYRQANWVTYILTKEKTIKSVERSNNFKADSLIPGTDNAIDYQKSGFDRGHLAPTGDMSYSSKAMKESFYFSNISPQNQSFNRGIWKKLEEQVRIWATEYDSIYIVVGPIFSDSMKTIGPHQIAVPKSFYKVILDNHKGKEKMIGFIIENQSSNQNIQNYTVSIDQIEKETGIDFFPLLNDDLENKLEKNVFIHLWKF
ncbi:MAG: DNA/RNA non-specific endonuclease [Flavobacteriia bacterium]|nr:DNA/RNA non-specific endonuclease [Flavobacteriia bacterium]